MTTGALLYAFDSDIKYTKIAIECATRIKKYLDIPIALVSDNKVNHKIFHKEIIVTKPTKSNYRHWQDTDQTTLWHNSGRSRALDLTPYDRTLLIDIDYMINSNVLKTLLLCKQTFFAHNTVLPVTKQFKHTEKFGQHKTPMWWATVLVFDKSDFTKDVFEMWKMVENNYQHYANVFGFDSRKFRNDYALSIALLVANGNNIPYQCAIPWPLVNVEPHIDVKLQEDKWTIDGKFYTQTQDLHIIGKSYLEKLYAV